MIEALLRLALRHAVQRLLQVDSLHSPHLGQEGLDQFDVLVGQFEDARHGVFFFASAGTLASRARFAREAHPLYWARESDAAVHVQEIPGVGEWHLEAAIDRLARLNRPTETVAHADPVTDFRLKSNSCVTRLLRGRDLLFIGPEHRAG